MEQVSDHKLDWLRSIKCGESKVGKLKTARECNTLSVLIYRFNIEEGPIRGIRISASYDRRNCTVTITANRLITSK